MKQSRAKIFPKQVPQQADEYEDNTETVFKHYDNKFFDMDELPKNSLVHSIPVPNMEIQELHQYVAKCYDDLYENFNEFKRFITSQLHNLQEEVQTLSFHNSSKNDGLFQQAVKESPSQALNGRPEAIEGRKETWGSISQKYEKDVEQLHHESRLEQLPEGRSSAQSEEPTPEQKLLYHLAKGKEQLIEHIPAGTWSNFTPNITETSSSHRKHATIPAEKRQDATHPSCHLHRSHPPNNTARKGNESWHEVGRVTRVETKEYDVAEQENEQAIKKLVSEYNDNQKSNNEENGQLGVGRDRFTLHGWAASFLQETAEGQLSKVNKPIVKQETVKYNDKESPSSQVEMEQSEAEMEITSKRASKGSTPQDLKHAKHITHMHLNSIKPDSKRQQPQPQLPRGATNVCNSDPEFPGKKCRGGIAWTVDELAEQNKQRAVN